MRSQLVRVQIDQYTCSWFNNLGIATQCFHLNSNDWCELYDHALESTSELGYLRCKDCLQNGEDKIFVKFDK